MQPDLLPPPTRAVVVRSYLALAAISLLGALYVPLFPLIILPRGFVRAVFHSYLRAALWLLKVICGMSYRVTMLAPLPPGPVLYAAKHQSAWDSAILPMLLGDPVAITRRDLLKVPIMGWLIWRMRHIPLNGRDPESFRAVLREAAKRVAAGRSLLIFPEGTRRPVAPYPEPEYERGVGALYQVMGVACVPIALNSGCFWRRPFIRCPGVIEVEIQPAIPPGLPRPDFVALMTERIETASRRLTEKGLAEVRGRSDRAVGEPGRA